MSNRILIYAPGTGLGHLRRSHNIAKEVVRRTPDCSILVFAESQATPFFAPLQGVDYVKLPTIVKRDSYTWEVDTLNVDLERVLTIRKQMIEQACRAFEPDTIFIDHRPVGLLGELKPLLTDMALWTHRPRLFLGLREISDDPAANLRRWKSIDAYEYLHFYEKILIYGCRHIYDSVSAYGLHGHDVSYCNYVTPAATPSVIRAKDREKPFVLVTGGGGEDSLSLITLFLDALPRLLGKSTVDYRIVAGPSMPASQFETINARCKTLPVTLLRSCDDVSRLIQESAAVVSMAGYNTMCEILLGRKKALVIPRASQTAEQCIRSQRFAELGLVTMIDPAKITPNVLAARLLDLLADDAVPNPAMIPPLDGAQRIASLLVGAPGTAISSAAV